MDPFEAIDSSCITYGIHDDAIPPFVQVLSAIFGYHDSVGQLSALLREEFTHSNSRQLEAHSSVIHLNMNNGGV